MDFIDRNKLVVVEQPWLDISKSLPDTLERKVYGSSIGENNVSTRTTILTLVQQIVIPRTFPFSICVRLSILP